MNASLVSDAEEPHAQPDPQPEPQPELPKDEGHAFWAYVWFAYPLSLYHDGNLGFSSWKSLVFTIMLVSAVLSMVMYSFIHLYGAVKSIAYTNIGNVFQGNDNNGLPIYTLPPKNNHTESPSGNYHFV